jgi:hypothetical protein
MYGMAQIKLLDLSILPVNSNTNDSVTLLIQFKARDVADIQGINLIFETQPNLADVFQTNATVMQQGNHYTAVLGNNETPINNYMFNLYCTITKIQYDAYHHIRVVVNYNDNTTAFLQLND